MKILFTSSRGLGHLYPLLPLARAARRAGDDILFAVPESLVPAVAEQVFLAAATTTGAPIASRAPSADETLDPMALGIREYWGRAVVRETLPHLQRIIAWWGPDLVVSEVMNFAGPLAAEAAGVPHVPVGVNALQVGHVGLDVTAEPLNEARRGLGLTVEPGIGWVFRHLYATPFPGFLEHPDLVRPRTTITYRHEDPDGHTPALSGRRRPGAGRRPTVYASLGTAAGEDLSHLEVHLTVLSGLGLVDADVVFTTGRMDPAALGLLPHNVRVAEHLPPRVAMDCDVVLTHAGAGTTTAALSRGLPLVCLPLFGDQPHNAARVHAAGAGLALDSGAGARVLAAALTEVLETPSYRSVARSLASTMGQAPLVDAVVPLLRDLAAGSVPCEPMAG
jgi:UDP:flavonoid glycosyltransferase YjiC (YdhE family)